MRVHSDAGEAHQVILALATVPEASQNISRLLEGVKIRENVFLSLFDSRFANQQH
jgi:hypothetical protein